MAEEISMVDGSQSPISLREEIALKREDNRLKAISNCTFQPSLTPQKKSMVNVVSPVSSNRFDDLYNDAMKRKIDNPKSVVNETENKPITPHKSVKSQSLMIDSMHNASGAGRVFVKEQAKELFQPKINKSVNSANKSTVEDTSARLYSAKDLRKDNLQKKMEEAAHKEKAECTFSPTLYRTRSVSAFSNSSANSVKQGNVADRLSLYGEVKKSKLEEEIKLKAVSDLIGVTFQPMLSAKKLKNDGRDGDAKLVTETRFDHLYKDAIKRQSEDLSVKVKVAEKDNTFKPLISAKAKSTSEIRKPSDLANDMHNATGSGRSKISPASDDAHTYKPAITRRGSSIDRSVDISEHLYAQNFIQKEKLETKQYEEALKVFEECTFIPKLSAKSKISIESDLSFASDNDAVVDRLLEYGERKKRILEEEVLARAQSAMVGVTFQPTLSTRNSIISNNEETLESSNGSQFDRLYSDAIKRKTEDPLVRARVDETHLTYKPVISALAKSIDRSTFKDINQRQKEANLKKKEEELLKRTQESTFAYKPLISKRASSLDRSSLNTINANIKELAEIKKKEAAARMTEENTFVPKIPVFEFTRSRVSSVSPASKKTSPLSPSSLSEKSYTSDSSISTSAKNSPRRKDPQNTRL